MSEREETVVPLLRRALHRIRSTPPRVISSPPTQQRRAAVAILIRVVPAPNVSILPTPENPLTLTEFFDLEWVNHPLARPEILFLQREISLSLGSTNDGSLWQTKPYIPPNEAHVAFPGGRQEPDDEGGLYTAMRQTWEEIGIDLAEPCYTCVGQLDDREITTSLGKRLLMILSPYVFLQITPTAPPAEPVESTTLHWTPLSALVSPDPGTPQWSTVTVDAASRLASKHSAVLRVLVRIFIGSMQFPAIVLPHSAKNAGSDIEADVTEKLDEKPKLSMQKKKQAKMLKLWGLSLGMTLDLMSYMILPTPPPRLPTPPHQTPSTTRDPASPTTPLSEVMYLPYQNVVDPHDPDFRMEYVAPSLASVFPKFSYPDVNFWIWVFGKRYREVVRGWEASVRAGGTNDRRVNWSGTALSNFYAAIRKALIVVIVARALGLLFGVSFALWWILS